MKPTKEQRRAAHRAKMMGKFFRNQERGLTEAEQMINRGYKPRPNRSKHHGS
jgi:hypothetical protein